MTTTTAPAPVPPARTAPASVPEKPGPLARATAHGGMFIAPFVLLYGLFTLIPAGRGIWMSFTDANIAGTTGSFVGLDNYAEAFDDPRVWDGLTHTLQYTALIVPAIVVLAFALALLTHHLNHGTWFWRLAFFAPFLLPAPVVADTWRWIFQPEFGLLNHVLGTRIPWLVDERYALFAPVIATVWWTIGFSFLLFLAALQAIPAHLYEAASLDGANGWHKIRHITLPGVRSITGLVVLLQILATLQIFDQVFIMFEGGPGPNESTRTFVQYALEQGFTGYRLGYASAITNILFVLIVGVTLLRMWLQRMREGGTK